jgi:hypothetical protein
MPPSHLVLELILCSVCAEHPLLVLSPEGRLLLGLTLKFPHWISSSVIHDSVFFSQIAQLQGEMVLGYVSGDRVAALKGLAIV